MSDLLANVSAIDLTRILETVRDIFSETYLIVPTLGGLALSRGVSNHPTPEILRST